MSDEFMLESHPADALLPPLLKRLESALDLATSADATVRFREVVQLCREAMVIADVGMLVAEPSGSG